MLTWEEAWPAIPSPRDKNGEYRKKVNALSRRTGWTFSCLWYWFEQIACSLEYECGIKRGQSEPMSHRMLIAAFDKNGQVPD